MRRMPKKLGSIVGSDVGSDEGLLRVYPVDPHFSRVSGGRGAPPLPWPSPDGHGRAKSAATTAAAARAMNAAAAASVDAHAAATATVATAAQGPLCVRKRGFRQLLRWIFPIAGHGRSWRTGLLLHPTGAVRPGACLGCLEKTKWNLVSHGCIR